MKLKGIKSVASVVIAVLLLMTSTLAVAAAIGRGEAEYVAQLELRSFADGLSIDEIKEIRADVLVRAKGLLSASGEVPLALAEPVITDGIVIVAFGFVVRPDGVPSQYVAMVGSEESVERVHEQAGKWLHREKMVREPSKLDLQGSLTGEAGITAGSASWIQIGFSTNTWDKPPYGQFTNHGRLFQLSNDGSATHDFFAVRQWATTTPGYIAHSSDWRNYRQVPQHNWGWGQLGAEMIDRDPLGTISGSQTIGVSLTGGTAGALATISWSYTQPNVTTYDTSVLVPPRARWEQHFTSAASQNTSGGMEPGSAVKTIQPGPGTYRLLEQKAYVRYRDPGFWGDSFRAFVHRVTWRITY